MTRLFDFDFSTLTHHERLLLAQQLQESVLEELDPLTPEQLSQMHRRLEAVESGQDQPISWQRLRAELP